VLAFLMFWIYRQDRKSSEERFAEIIKQAELFIYLKARNGGRAQANG